MALPTNIDASYPDRSAGDKAHQQDHDSVHAFYNKFDHSTAPAAGNTWVWDATAGVYKPGSGAYERVFKSGGYYFADALQNGSNAVQLNGDLVVTEFTVGEAITISELSVQVTAAGAGAAPTFRFGIYRDDGDGHPGALELDAGTVGIATTGVMTLTGLSHALAAGRYWIGGSVYDSATTAPQFRSFVGGTQAPAGLWYSSASLALAGSRISLKRSGGGLTGALPAPFGTVANDVGCPVVVVKVA